MRALVHHVAARPIEVEMLEPSPGAIRGPTIHVRFDDIGVKIVRVDMLEAVDDEGRAFLARMRLEA